MFEWRTNVKPFCALGNVIVVWGVSYSLAQHGFDHQVSVTVDRAQGQAGK